MRLFSRLLLPLFFFLFSLFFVAHADAAVPPVVINDQTIEYDLAGFMEMFLTKSHHLSIDEVSSPEFSKNFVPYSFREQTAKKNYSSTVWLRFKVNNPTDHNRLLFLTQDFPSQYIKWTVYLQGPDKKFVKSALPSKTLPMHLYPLSIPAHSSEEFYLTNYSEGFLQTTFFLKAPYDTLLSKTAIYFLIGIEYGIVIALILHSAIIYLFLRDKSYLLYIAFVSSGLLAFVLLDGLLNGFPNIEVSNWFYLHVFRFNLVLNTVLYLMFAKTVLRLKQYAPRINYFINFYLSLSIPLAVMAFLPSFGSYHFQYAIIFLISSYITASFFISFFATLFVIRTGYKPAKYYFAGVLGLTTSIFFYYYFSLPGNFISAKISAIVFRLPMLGLDVDMILQAIALSVRFDLIKQSEIVAQAEIIKQKTLNSNLQEKALKDKQDLIDAYTRFFPRRFLELLKKKSILQIKLGDHVENTMTVLFADLRNFTSILEKKTSEESFYFINNYLSQIGPLIRKYNGVVDKYIGDAILALFDQKAEDAIETAVEIVMILRNIEHNMTSEGRVEMGIGIHFGSLMVGTIGEQERMDGTVISDTVNVASRIENLNKIYGTNIIISKQVVDTLRDKDRFKLRFLDHILLKGKQLDIILYEVFDNDPPDIKEKKIAMQEDFHAAIKLYQEQKFEDALHIFERCHAILPEDKLISLYIGRCKAGHTRGFDKTWQPIARFTQKIEIK